VQSIINRIENNQFWKFHGGIHPPEQKFLTTNRPIRTLHLPNLLIIPVQQHIGVPGDIRVKEGDYVLKGESLTSPSSPMAVPVHAPTSGVIEKIALHIVAHPSGLSELCIFLKPDHLDKWCDRKICTDFKSLSRNDIVNKISQAGISGMGGAGFPTHIKVDSKPNIDFLIINAAECEPYITADDLLMREHAATIIQGVQILQHLLIPRKILIGIEDNKPEAITSLQTACKDIADIHVCVLPTKYPTGGEKQLIKVLTGKEISSGSLPIQQGIVMQNVATCFAIAEAVIDDIPLIKRVVTVSGQGLEKPQNVWAAIGTQVKHLVSMCVSKQANEQKAIIMGGPMMGFTLPSDHVPVIKTTNCILVPDTKELALNNQEVECIRCGECAEVCPSQLLPQELQWSAKAKDYNKLKSLNLFDCIDCGACAYVCPSHIPLVQYYRIAKAEIRQQEVMDLKAEKAKARFEARKERLEREKKEREEKQRKASEARRAAMENKSADGTSAKSAVAAALARVKAKKARNVEGENKTSDVNTQENEQKSQVAAAIARAKAKKAKSAEQKEADKEITQQAIADTSENKTAATESSTKSARVAAAIAKAKAKKAQASGNQQENDNLETSSDKNTTLNTASKTSNNSESKTDKIALAIAKAKAKKKSQASKKSDEDSDVVEIDAKAKNTQAEDNKLPERNLEPDPDKKARIAAAVAKAKAKKQKESN